MPVQDLVTPDMALLSVYLLNLCRPANALSIVWRLLRGALSQQRG